MMKKNLLASLVAASALGGASQAATIQIALNYNWNGIVNTGENGVPDAINGYRSISDRGLDFTAGVPSDALLNKYHIVSTANTLDIVYLGDRSKTDIGGAGGGNFDATVDGDNIGIAPAWLGTENKTTPQTTVLSTPILMTGTSGASFIYQISNGGGNFNVVFGFSDSTTVTTNFSATDWYANGYAGTGGVDSGNTGDHTLSITEGTFSLSASAGKTLTSITFQNPSNTTSGFAILAANVDGTVPETSSVALLGLGGLLALRRRRL